MARPSTSPVLYSLKQAKLVSLSFNPAALTGGANSTGTITLSGAAPTGGLKVNLSSNSAAATVPTSVTVLAGSTTVTFKAATNPVATTTDATITATQGTHTATSSLTVSPPVLTSLGLSSSTLFGGASTTGTVALNAPAPTAGMIVMLSSDLSTVTVPATVTIPSGDTTAKFTVNTTAISQVTFGTIAAKLNGKSAQVIITVSPPVLTGLTLSQSSVTGGKTTVATLTIGSPAPVGGLAISMSAGTTVAAFLNTVIIPAGKTSATFTIVTIPLPATTTDTITATLISASVNTTLTITP